MSFVLKWFSFYGRNIRGGEEWPNRPGLFKPWKVVQIEDAVLELLVCRTWKVVIPGRKEKEVLVLLYVALKEKIHKLNLVLICCILALNIFCESFL